MPDDPTDAGADLQRVLELRVAVQFAKQSLKDAKDAVKDAKAGVESAQRDLDLCLAEIADARRRPLFNREQT